MTKAEKKIRSDVRHQHSVPQMLLRPFTRQGSGKKAQLHVFDKQTERTFKSSTEGVFAQRDFNTFEGEGLVLCLEDGMAELENLAATVLRKIIETRSVADLTPEERAALCAFAALQKTRGVALRAQMEEMVETLRAKLAAVGDDPDAVPQLKGGNTTDDNKLAALNLIRENLGEFAQSFDNKTIILIEAAPKESFLIGDTPVTWMNHRDTGPYGNLGLEVAGIELYLPISPQLTIAFWCPTILEKMQRELEQATALAQRLEAQAVLGVGQAQKLAAQGRDHAKAIAGTVERKLASIATGGPMSSTPENMEHLNALQIAQAERYIASSDGDFGLVRRMLADNEKFRRGARFEIS